jgi:hypothetical protein
MQLAVPAYRFQGPFEKAWEQAHERGMSDVRDARESGVESRESRVGLIEQKTRSSRRLVASPVCEPL